MKKWEIWSEGYRDNGGGRGAHLLGVAWGDTFDNAMHKHIATCPDSSYYRKNEDGSWSMWGCRLFDNEHDARKTDHIWMGR